MPVHRFPTMAGLLVCGLALLVCAKSLQAQIPSQAQERSDTRATKDYGYGGQVSVLVQDATGEPFFSGAELTLFTQSIDARQTLRTTSDLNGKAQFTALPTGTYVIEITAPGYRTVQQQVIIVGTQRIEDLVVSMVPKEVSGKINVGPISASPKAVKETEKALHALQLSRIDEAQEHLQRALAVDPNFVDGNYLMGVVLLRRKQPDKASAYLKKSVELSPDHAAAFLALGEAQYLEHDYAHATESLEKFLSARPHNPQATTAQKYVEAMGKQAATPVSGDGQMELASADASKASLGGDVSALPELNPITEANWAPPDVDEEKLELDNSADCQLDEVVRAAGHRMQELVTNVDRFTASESVAHDNLSPMGLATSRETRKFNYVVEIHPVGKTDLDVQEYRNGSVATDEFPGHIATVGLPSLALIFHPNLEKRYEFQCEGRGSWAGHSAWVVHFQQRADQNSGMLVYHLGNRFVAVKLKGRAWIDTKSSQILAMESDIMRPLPEIRLMRDHQLIEYGPVSFHDKAMQLWLPKSADWYCSLSGKRFHRRHTFNQFLLFSVDDKQKINAPPAAAQ